MPNYHLKLKGFVGGYDFDASYVDYILSKNQGKPVDVLIDSLGGSLATALSIVASFREHGQVHVHYVGMNASAATIVSMGANHVTMDASAMYLVHKCSAEFIQWASLNADQLKDQIAHLEQMKTDLEKMDANVASLYAAKCKKPASELLDLMKVGGWLTAQEALAWGFVDEITDSKEDKAPVLTEATACAMASAGIPLPHMPIQPEQSEWSKFLSSFMQFFSGRASELAQPKALSTPNQTVKDMKNLFPLIVAALALTDEAFAMDAEGNVTLNLNQSQLQALEREMKGLHEDVAEANGRANGVQSLNQEISTLKASAEAKDQEIATLKARVEELGRQPGETTHQVHNSAGADPQKPKSDVEQFFDTNREARELFNRLP
jgi:ATP-dependent protease ClpP protease subunit